MKRDKILVAIFGFILQVVLLFLICIRTNLGDNLLPYIILFAALNLLYNVLFGQDDSLTKSSIIYFFGTIAAGVLSGLAVGVDTTGLAWLLIDGIITGFLVAMLTYHLKRLFFGGIKERGFYPIEISLTFFSCVAYAVIAYLTLEIVDAAMMTAILLMISLLLGWVLSIPYQRSARLISEVIKRGYHVEDFPIIKISIFREFWEELKEFFSRLRKSYQEIAGISDNLKSSSENLSSASAEMSASLEEVSSTIQHIAKGAQDDSEAMTAIARSIEELNNLTTSISSQVKTVSDSSQKTSDSAKKGTEISVREAKVAREIFEHTKFIEDKMAELRDRTTEIKKVLGIINDITGQTDLLALNAAIEAARVGEQGRGFAVVADEIRNLATETQRSSATVENFINEINRTTQELGNLLTLEREKIAAAKDLATQTEEEFTGIAKAVEQVSDMVNRISTAAANQSENTKQLVTQVEQVAQVAADTASSTEEVSAAVEEQTASLQEFTSTAQMLASVAKKLDEFVKSMKE